MNYPLKLPTPQINPMNEEQIKIKELEIKLQCAESKVEELQGDNMAMQYNESERLNCPDPELAELRKENKIMREALEKITYGPPLSGGDNNIWIGIVNTYVSEALNKISNGE